MFQFDRHLGRFSLGGIALAAVVACASEPGGPDPSAIPEVPSELDPGTSVAVSGQALESLTALSAHADTARAIDADGLRQGHAVSFSNELGYDPTTASNLAMILANHYAPGQEPLAALSERGFVVDTRQTYPSFAYGYSEIYAQDLPVFISSDMVLEAIYRSHDKILQDIEQDVLVPALDRLLSATRKALIAEFESFPADVASDLNFYLGVAQSLLDDGKVGPREPAGVEAFVKAAMEAAGEQRRVLFGVERSFDFSQFRPRGHYAGEPELENYFRTMIWLGRVDFRLLETTRSGDQVLRRRQVDSMLALNRLIDGDLLADYLTLDETISAFAGQHDYMTLQQAGEFLSSLGGQEGLTALGDEELAEELVASQFGQQRIASHVMRRDPGGSATFPLNVSFALFGQRYTVDSHVFSNVVYDRVPTRVVPDPLDVAFGAMGNDQAVALLGDQLDSDARYPGELAAIRLLVDEHPAEYWQSSLYTGWLNALRTLSPGASLASDLPTVAKTEAWGRRLLNTQLASWAQLRHNNVLYVKQSYTSSAACEYPDAYVDPYPDFFNAVVAFAERARELTLDLGLGSALQSKVVGYFDNVAAANTILAQMAEHQRSGSPHSEEHLAFVNRAVTAGINCDGTILGHDGWYADLHYDPLQAVEADPAITDVHTDIGGELPVNRPPTVLHVATGSPRLMILTVDSCQGPRAYAGVVSSYHEVLQEGLVRWTDAEWKQEAWEAPDVEWMRPILVE